MSDTTSTLETQAPAQTDETAQQPADDIFTVIESARPDGGGESAEDGENGESSPPNGEGEGEQKAPEPPKEDRRQKRIKQLLSERDAARQESARLLGQMDALRTMAPQVQPHQQAAQQQPQEVTEPRIENFGNFDEFTRAHTAWNARNAVNEAIQAYQAEASRLQQAQAQQQSEAQAQAAAAEFMSRGEKAYPGFTETLRTAPAPTQAMAQALLTASEGPAVALYLAQKPEEVSRIAALPPLSQVMEMGKLNAQVELARAKRSTSSAPPPINPVGTKSGGTSFDAFTGPKSVKEWMEWRNKQARE